MIRNYFKNLIHIFLLFEIIDTKSQACIDTTLINKNYSFEFCDDYFNQNFNPVCGCNGRTYLNPKCAKYTDGVISYTLGGGCICIDKSVIDTTKIYTGQDVKVDLVCGCDGNAYLNKRIAYFKFGVTRFKSIEECECNSLKTYYRTFDESDCGDDFIDPSLIRPIINYVCGCDSITYVNPCQAYNKGRVAKIVHAGSCHCIDSTKIVKSFPCEDEYKPVCGCDTITYKNACVATNNYGVTKYKDGPCPCIIPSYIDSTYPCDPLFIFGYKGLVCGCDGITYENICVARKKYGIHKYTEGPCICVDSSLINLQIGCPDYFQPVCGCNKKTYINNCVATYTNGVKYFDSKPCSCKDTNLINIDKTCNEQFLKDPVCGCDSNMYINSCQAIYKNGITGFYKGYCKNTCVANNLIDTSAFCSQVYEPVCGCDKKTYTNECIAQNRFGVVRWQKGRCDSLIFTSSHSSAVLSIYPNPASSNINMECSDFPIQSYSINNLEGKFLLNEKINQNNALIDISEFSDGIYFISLEIQGEIYRRKFIVQK